MSPHRTPHDPHDPHDPDTEPHDGLHDDLRDDPDLAALLRDCLEDVEPRAGLEQIRARTRATTRPKVSPMPARRPWTYAVGGAVVATAAVIAAVAVAGDRLGLTDDDAPTASHSAPVDQETEDTDATPGPDDQETSAPVPTSAASGPAMKQVTPEPPPTTLAAYYPGSSPQGPRLYREFDKVAAVDPLAGAVGLLQSAPADPDYHSTWPAGSFDGAHYRAEDGQEQIEVTLARADLQDRPAGMSEREARVAVQQVVYTLQAAVQSRAAVVFELGGHAAERVYGVDTSSPVHEDPPLEVLALVSVSSPVEGQHVSGSFTADGVASSFEATVPWRILQDGKPVESGFATAEGWMDKLYPWRTDRIDVSDLPAGTYTFEAATDDPSASEGPGPYVDTRTIVVE